MVAQVADHVDEMVAEIRVSIETGIILIQTFSGTAFNPHPTDSADW